MLADGARAASINRIVDVSGAPKGSVYHRFGGIDDLHAAMWARAVRRSQEGWLTAIAGPDPAEAAVAAALSVFDFAAEHPADARLLASLRREDLVDRASDPALLEDLARLNGRVREALAELARRLTGRASRRAVEAVALVTVDLPLGAVRRHLADGQPPPGHLRPLLEAAARQALAVLHGPGRPSRT